MMKHYDKIKQYLWPWVLLPFALIYAADFAQAIIFIIQLCCTFLLSLLGAGLFVGAYIAILENLRDEHIKQIRLYKVLPTIVWGYVLVGYLLGEVDDAT